MADLIRQWHIVIPGFCQTRAEPNGSQKLWLALGQLRSPTTCVLLLEWDSPWDRIAEWIWRTSSNGTPPTICVYAYSWGVGNGLVRLAEELGKRCNLKIATAVCCDGVYRSRFYSTRWLAFCRTPRIKMPPNVLDVRGVRQMTDRWVQGHDIVATSPDQTVQKLLLVRGTDHAHIDDHPVFQEQCKAVAGIA
jgi:hypothetical protein